ncbi:HEAT repeat domain-containing protein [Planktothrix sp. FACHB-1375]|uniref:HEAT repeat domain-containing protein n=4 Tax=Oscillatoriophycideae TaxID=1301283 RepID=A0A926ZF68_9CYAN|nr:HEAT repeat domain-containing protein [Aerosakkonema funiforme FACHB-1375]
MIDWLVAWGVTQAVGFAFKPILEDLAKEATKDWAKDIFKGCLNKVIQLPSKEPLDIAAGKALKEFLQLVQQELEDADFDEEKLKEYIKPLKQFIKDEAVAETLGNAFQYECHILDTKTLAEKWKQLNLPPLPSEFDWEKLGKRYLKKAKAIIQESDDLREIFKAQTLAEIAENTRVITPDFDLRKYQEGIRERYGNLKLDSIDRDGYAYNQLKLWQMFIPQNVRECQEFLPKVYEIPKEYQKRLQERGELEREFSPEELERWQQSYQQERIRSISEILDDRNYKYLVILGDPGAGKSSLLQWISLNWAELPPNELPLQPIPLLIELRAYSLNREDRNCKDFLEFFHAGSGVVCHLPQHQLNEKLKAGDAVVMFDGLDEIFDSARREEVITDIHRFTNDYPKVRVIVTSRVIGYKAQKLRDAEFRHFMLQDLEPEQIEDFIQRWHDRTYNDEGDKVKKRERLKKAIRESSAIRELAGNPLLLTMMAILNRNQELPRDRPELYNQSSRLLLHHWDFERTLKSNFKLENIDYKDKQAMLRQVAYYMQANEKGLAGNLIAGEDLERILYNYLKSIEIPDARTVARLTIEQLRVRNFILCSVGADYYAFVHRTFLEYFCAWEFVWQFEKDRKIDLDYLKNEVFGKHWEDERWHEVLRLIVGMLGEKFAGELIDYLIQQNGNSKKHLNLFLAFDCLGEVRNQNTLSATSEKLLNKMKDIIALEVIDENEIINNLPIKNLHLDRSEWVICHEEMTKIISIIAIYWRDHPETLEWLKNIIQFDKRIDVRREALQCLTSGWQGNNEILSVIKNCIRNDKHGAVRSQALTVLAWMAENDPETLSILKASAKTDISPAVRLSAIQDLVHNWKDDPDTLPILKNCIFFDTHSNTRVSLIQDLANSYKDDPDTLPIIKKLAQSDKDPSIRWISIYKLCEIWKDNAEIFEVFYDCVVNDRYEGSNNQDKSSQLNPRYLALEAIILNYPNNPQTLPLLRDRAENDSDEKIRLFAEDMLNKWNQGSNSEASGTNSLINILTSNARFFF